jgi:hypothetical protein
MSKGERKKKTRGAHNKVRERRKSEEHTTRGEKVEKS